MKKVFYSWQSDTPNSTNRGFIQKALEIATSAITSDEALSIDVVVDRDTEGVAGAPDIATTIFGKIDAAAAFVADVTLTNMQSGPRPTANPNVLIELGYAIKALGWERVILVLNRHFGGPEDLPFDLRPRRVVTYSAAPEEEGRAPERTRLAGALESQLRTLFSKEAAPTASAVVPQYALDVTWRRHDLRIMPNRHDYRLIVAVRNVGTTRVDDFRLEVSFPTAYLGDGRGQESHKKFTIIESQFPEEARRLYPGDELVALSLDYFVDTLNWPGRHAVLGTGGTPEAVHIRLCSGNMPPVEREVPMSDLENF